MTKSKKNNNLFLAKKKTAKQAKVLGQKYSEVQARMYAKMNENKINLTSIRLGENCVKRPKTEPQMFV